MSALSSLSRILNFPILLFDQVNLFPEKPQSISPVCEIISLKSYVSTNETGVPPIFSSWEVIALKSPTIIHGFVVLKSIISFHKVSLTLGLVLACTKNMEVSIPPMSRVVEINCEFELVMVIFVLFLQKIQIFPSLLAKEPEQLNLNS